MNRNAVIKHGLQRPVGGGITTSTLVRYPAVRHDNHLVGMQGK